MSTRSENGSAHAVVVICLVFALIAALGWIFYQNFIDKHEQSPASQNKQLQAQEAPRNETIATKEYDTKVEFTYPEQWEASRNIVTNEAGKFETIKILKANTATKVVVQQSSDGQFGGACDPDDASFTIQYLKVTPITNRTDVSHYGAVVGEDGDYQLVSQVLENNDVTKQAKVGGSGCNIFNLQGILKFSSKDLRNTVSVNIHSGKLENSDGTYKAIKDKKDIESIINSDDYKAAVKIVQSMKIAQ